MNRTFSVRNKEWPVLLGGLLVLLVGAGAVHAQASGPGGGIAAGMSGAAEGQGQVLSGQSSSAGGTRSSPGAPSSLPETTGSAPVKRDTRGNKGMPGKDLSGGQQDYSTQQGTDAGRVSGRNSPSGIPGPASTSGQLGASPGSQVGR